MRIIEGLENVQRFEEPTAVTIGVYDGVHLGHRYIIERCVERAKKMQGLSVVITFEPMPLALLAPDEAPQRITTLKQKAIYLEELGIDVLLVAAFDERFAAMAPSRFIDVVLSEKLNAKVVVVGSDFRFGKGRSGDVEFLRRYLLPKGVDVEVVEQLKIGGVPVSSTRIRKLLDRGDIEAAAKLLGRYPVVEGTVIAGRRRGKKLGFATANVDVENPGAVPECGVYAGFALIDSEKLPAVVDVGTSPTFKDVKKVEFHVHVIGFDRDIYGKKIGVELIKRLREEVPFESVGELRAQIKRDIDEAVGFLGERLAERSGGGFTKR